MFYVSNKLGYCVHNFQGAMLYVRTPVMFAEPIKQPHRTGLMIPLPSTRDPHCRNRLQIAIIHAIASYKHR